MYASYLTDTAYNALPEWSPRGNVLTRRDRAETIWFAIVPGARENLDLTKTLMTTCSMSAFLKSEGGMPKAEGDGTARSPAIGLVSWGFAEGSCKASGTRNVGRGLARRSET